MVTLIPDGVFLQDGQHIIPATAAQAKENANVFDATKAYKETMAYRILMTHQTGMVTKVYKLNLMLLPLMTLPM